MMLGPLGETDDTATLMIRSSTCCNAIRRRGFLGLAWGCVSWFLCCREGLSCATSKLTLQGSLRGHGINFRGSSTEFRGIEG